MNENSIKTRLNSGTNRLFLFRIESFLNIDYLRYESQTNVTCITARMAERTARTIYRVRVVPVPSMLLIAILSAIRTTASAMIFKAAMNVTPTYMPWKRSESENYAVK